MKQIKLIDKSKKEDLNSEPNKELINPSTKETSTEDKLKRWALIFFVGLVIVYGTFRLIKVIFGV